MDASSLLWIVLGFTGLVLLWIVVTYNSFVRHANYCNDAWADIDTELKRRYDLIPNLVETVKAYAAHERTVLESVMAARNAAQANHGSPREQARDENALSGRVRQLMAVAEAYPDLKAGRNFLALQQELTDTEDRIQRARRFYNGNVRDLNTRIEVIPSNIIAGWFGFTKREYFEIDDTVERNAPALNLP
jgi:LemA protein